MSLVQFEGIRKENLKENKGNQDLGYSPISVRELLKRYINFESSFSSEWMPWLPKATNSTARYLIKVADNKNGDKSNKILKDSRSKTYIGCKNKYKWQCWKYRI